MTSVNKTGRRELSIDRRTGQSQVPVPSAPLLTSSKTAWRGCLLEEHPHSDSAVAELVRPDHLVLLQLRSEASVGWHADGRWQTAQVRPGQVSVVPAHLPHSVRFGADGGCAMLSLTPGFFAQAAAGAGAGGAVELRPRFGADDPLAAQLLTSLRAEAAAGAPGGRHYGEALATALAGHLVRHFAVRPQACPPSAGQEHPRLRRVLEHLHAHLTEDLSLQVLAGVAGLSPWYLTRLFKRATGLAPHGYVVRRRLERAQELLAGETPLAEIAQQLRFCDQSHFAAQFRRAFGVTPLRFRIELRSRPR